MRILIAVFALLALAAPAQAATVAREGTEIVYRSDPGEQDDFVGQVNEDVTPNKLYFYERGAKFTLGAGCTRGKYYPECPLDGVTAIRVFAGDGDDNVNVLHDLPLFVDLGPGKDQFHGRASQLTLTAGDGDDLVDAEVGGGSIDLGPGTDRAPVWIASVFTGPLAVVGGDGDDALSITGHAERGIALSGGAGNDAISGDLYESTNGMDVSCGPGNDRTRLRLADRLGDGCAPLPTGFDPGRVARTFRATLPAPGQVEVIFRRRPGGGRRPAEVVARGSATRPAGPLKLRLKARHGRAKHNLKLYVFIRTRTAGDRAEVRFDSRLT
jgi:hypothetical protein